jgi:hypothetical protein
MINFANVYSKTFITYVSKDDIVILRIHNLSKGVQKVRVKILAKQKELYSSDLISINGEESEYFSLSEVVKDSISEKEEGIVVKIDLVADKIEEIEHQIITLSSTGGVLISKEAERLPPPVIQRVVPSKVSAAGGGLITIIGSNFDESAVVKIDGVETLRLRESQDRIIAIVPPHKPGKVSVQVENTGQKPFVLANALEYVAPQPVIQSVYPSSCSEDGGISVEINGSNFTENAKVFFGNAVALSSTYVNESKIIAVVPPHKAGVVSVKILNADGSQSVLNDAFKYYGHPYIKSIVPNMGPPEGGTLVTITGENFEEDAMVLFDGQAARINFVKQDVISISSPPHQSGYVAVEVKNANGLSTELPNGFLYNSPPKLIEAYAYPNPCLKRARVRVVMNAIDPENQQLYYQWNVSGNIGGTIIGSGNEVVFECPNIEGEATINVVISDEYNASIKTSITVSVR